MVIIGRTGPIMVVVGRIGRSMGFIIIGRTVVGRKTGPITMVVCRRLIVVVGTLVSMAGSWSEAVVVALGSVGSGLRFVRSRTS